MAPIGIKGNQQMKKILLIITVIIFLCELTALSLEDMSFGTDSSLEVMTWNIEWFPKSGSVTMDSVATIIQALDLDIYAIQEVSDTTAFKQMVDSIDNYEYYFYSGYFAGLAYVYKTDAITVNNIFEIYTTEPYWRPFPRSPMVMSITYNGDNYYIINNHLKAFSDGEIDYNDPWDNETRRYDACNYLKQYIDTALPNSKVIVLGDMNDVLTNSSPNNVFQNIIDDPTNFQFADMDIATGSSTNWSYPGYPSHIDHIFITNELYEEFNNDGSAIETLKIGDYMAGGFMAYDTFISDHYPVAIRFNNPTSIEESVTSIDPNLTNYPNPFNPSTVISFKLRERTDVNVTVYNIRGELITSLKEGIMDSGYHQLEWNGHDSYNRPVSSGIYFIRLITEKQTFTRKACLMK